MRPPRSSRAARIGLAVATATTLLFAASACAPGSGDGGTASGSSLTYWASNQGDSLDSDKQILAPVLAEFTKKTGVKVDLEVIGWNDLQTRLQTAVTSGQGPDVANIGNTWAASLQATGAFLPFGDAEMTAIGGEGKFVKAALETGGAAGEAPTSVPLYGLAYGLYYNKKLFADAGLEPPATWDEFVAAGQKLTAGDVRGLALTAGSYTENSHFGFINAAQNGAELFDVKGRPTFAADGVVDGVLRYLDLMQKARIVDPADAQKANTADVISVFARGKAAMMIMQNNVSATVLANGMPSDAFAVVPYPAPSGGKPVASHVAGINISVFKNAKNKDAALKLVEHLTSPETQARLNADFSSLPVLVGAETSIAGDPAQAETFQKIYETLAKPLPLVPAEDQYEATVGKAMNDLFARIATGSTVTRDDVKKALQTAQDDVAASLG